MNKYHALFEELTGRLKESVKEQKGSGLKKPEYVYVCTTLLSILQMLGEDVEQYPTPLTLDKGSLKRLAYCASVKICLGFWRAVEDGGDVR